MMGRDEEDVLSDSDGKGTGIPRFLLVMVSLVIQGCKNDKSKTRSS